MRRWLVPGIVASLLLAGVIVSLVSSEAASYAGFFGLLLGLSTAVALTYRRSARLSASERKAWRLIAAGLSSMAVGVFAVGALTAAEVQLPAFGGLDVFFLFGYVLIIAGIYRMTRLDSGGHEWVLTILDALVGGIALSALVWTFFFHDLMDTMAGAPWWEAMIAVAYPVADLMLVIAVLILVMRRSQYHLDLRLVFFALGAAKIGRAHV